MNIKTGYKQTEIGVIPEDWDVSNFGELATTVSSGTSKVSQIYGNYQVYGSTGVIGYSNKADYSGDAILVARVGANAGKLNLVSGEYGVTDNTIIIRLKNNYCLPFFWRQLEQKHLNNLVFGSGQPLITGTQIKDLTVALPPLSEQTAIAAALSDVDALMGELDKLIAKKRDIKQASMQQLLTGKKRLAGFSGKWEVKRLGDVGECLRGVTYKGDSDLSSCDTANTTRLLRSNNVQNATVTTSDIQFVNSSKVSEKQFLKKYDILVCIANGSKALVGKAGFFDVEDGYEYTFGAFMGCFRSNPNMCNCTFVFFLFQSCNYRNYINNLLAGTSINNLSPKSIELLEFKFPNIEEQTAIATILSDMDAEINALQQKREKTAQLKQGMMQELLTGRIRLPIEG